MINADHIKEHIDIVIVHIGLSDYLYVYENNRDNLMYIMVRKWKRVEHIDDGYVSIMYCIVVKEDKKGGGYYFLKNVYG